MFSRVSEFSFPRYAALSGKLGSGKLYHLLDGCPCDAQTTHLTTLSFSAIVPSK